MVHLYGLLHLLNNWSLPHLCHTGILHLVAQLDNMDVVRKLLSSALSSPLLIREVY